MVYLTKLYIPQFNTVCDIGVVYQPLLYGFRVDVHFLLCYDLSSISPLLH